MCFEIVIAEMMLQVVEKNLVAAAEIDLYAAVEIVLIVAENY